MPRWEAAFVCLAVAGIAACGGESDSGRGPCIIPAEEIASILERDEVNAAPQDDGVQCIYAAAGEPLVAVFVRTQEQFDAERARFEDMGVELPELRAVTGFDEEATVDPRYNSLNVTAGERVVTVEIVGREPATAPEQLALEQDIARAALARL